jgi:alpha-1,2-mannosyltransferase
MDRKRLELLALPSRSPPWTPGTKGPTWARLQFHEVTTTSVAERLDGIARNRSWWLPGISAAVTLVFFTTTVWFRQEVDLGTYLMGGAHAFSADLYRIRFPATHLGFTYPPFAALLFAPFAHLPLRLNMVVFMALSVGALFGLVAVSLRATCPALDRRALLWWALTLVGPAVLLAPERETLFFGQINLILIVAVVADMTMDLRLPKGVLVGLAAAVKLTPIILVPYLFLTRRTRAGCTALGAFAAAALVAAVASPHASWTYWSHDAWFPTRAGAVPFVGNQGALGVLDRLLRHSLTTVPTFAVVVTVGGIGLAVAAAVYRRSPLLGFIVIEATECLASPISWDHHFVFVVLLIAWLALAGDRPAHGRWWAAAVALVFWTAPIWWVPRMRYAGQGWRIPLADSFFLVMVAVVVGGAVRVVRRPVSAPDAISSPGTGPGRGGPVPDRSGRG